MSPFGPWPGEVTGGGGGTNPTFNAFVQDLGVARRSGTFDLGGLGGLTPGKDVFAVMTAQPIAAKGNARDEFEMQAIAITGYVLNPTAIRFYWNAQGNVAVGPYAFAYFVAG